MPKTDYNDVNITAVQSQWHVPYVSAGSTTNFQYAPTVGVWPGIGYADLLQAGSISAQSSGSPTFKMFTEDYPQNIVYEGPTIHSGDLVFVQVVYEGANQTLYYLENETSGVVDEISHSTPYVGEGDADYILERGNGLQLPSFSNFLVSANYFWQSGSSTSHELTTTKQALGHDEQLHVVWHGPG